MSMTVFWNIDDLLAIVEVTCVAMIHLEKKKTDLSLFLWRKQIPLNVYVYNQ